MKSLIARTLVSLFFIGLLYFVLRDELPSVFETLKNVNLGLLTAAFLSFTTGILIMGIRLKLIFRGQGRDLSWGDGVCASYIGFFFNNFLPTAVGGDVVKAYCVSRKTGHPMRAVTGVFMDRLLGLIMFVMIPGITVFFIAKELDPAIPRIVLTVWVAMAVVTFLLFHEHGLQRLSFLKPQIERIPMGKKVVDAFTSLMELARNRQLISKICIAAFISQIFNIVCLYLIILSLGAKVDLLFVFMVVPIVHLFSMLPSVNGLGVREIGFLYFFKGMIGEGPASAMAIVYLFMLILISFIGGVVYMFRPDYHFRLSTIRAVFSKSPDEAEKERVT